MTETFLLDTNVIIDFFKNRPTVRRLFIDLSRNDLAVSTVTIGEFLVGVCGRRREQDTAAMFFDFIKENRIGIFDFDVMSAKAYGQIQASLMKQGKMAPPFDALIAAVCIVNDLTLVTQNIRDFENIPGLKIRTP